MKFGKELPSYCRHILSLSKVENYITLDFIVMTELKCL